MEDITDKLKKLTKMRKNNVIIFEKNKRKYSKQNNSTNIEAYSYYE
jgi:hypothetical protein